MIYLRNLKNLNLFFFVVLYICRYIICIGCYGEKCFECFYNFQHLFDSMVFLLELMCSSLCLCVGHSCCFGSVRTGRRALLPTLESTINLFKRKILQKIHENEMLQWRMWLRVINITFVNVCMWPSACLCAFQLLFLQNPQTFFFFFTLYHDISFTKTQDSPKTSCVWNKQEPLLYWRLFDILLYKSSRPLTTKLHLFSVSL